MDGNVISLESVSTNPPARKEKDAVEPCGPARARPSAANPRALIPSAAAARAAPLDARLRRSPSRAPERSPQPPRQLAPLPPQRSPRPASALLAPERPHDAPCDSSIDRIVFDTTAASRSITNLNPSALMRVTVSVGGGIFAAGRGGTGDR